MFTQKNKLRGIFSLFLTFMNLQLSYHNSPATGIV